MSGQLLSSKVVVVEEEPRVRGIPSAPTSVAGAVGITERGPIDEAVRLCREFPNVQEAVASGNDVRVVFDGARSRVADLSTALTRPPDGRGVSRSKSLSSSMTATAFLRTLDGSGSSRSAPVHPRSSSLVDPSG